MPTDPTSLWQTIIASLVAPVLLAVLWWIREARKDRAGATHTEAEARSIEVAADTTVNNLLLAFTDRLERREQTLLDALAAAQAQWKIEVDALQHDFAIMREENTRLRLHNHLLSEQVVSLGAVPAAMPMLHAVARTRRSVRVPNGDEDEDDEGSD